MIREKAFWTQKCSEGNRCQIDISNNERLYKCAPRVYELNFNRLVPKCNSLQLSIFIEPFVIHPHQETGDADTVHLVERNVEVENPQLTMWYVIKPWWTIFSGNYKPRPKVYFRPQANEITWYTCNIPYCLAIQPSYHATQPAIISHFHLLFRCYIFFLRNSHYIHFIVILIIFNFW